MPQPSYPAIAGWGSSPDELVVRIDIDEALPGGGLYTFGLDGSVVRVADTSVSMSRGDLTTWRLTRGELRTVLGRLDALRVRTRESDLDSTFSHLAVWYWIDGHERVLETSDPETLAAARDLTSAPDTGVHRWVPREIGFLAGRPDHTGRSPLGPRAPFAAWPLAQRVRDLALGTLPNAYNEQKLAICLRGRAARKAWTLFTGVNTAYLRVDDGQQWELQSYVTTPGYRASGAPCVGGPAHN